MCVDKVCGEEEEAAAEEAEEPGIQNQKQEPHTKMWGKKMSLTMMNYLPKLQCTPQIIWFYPHPHGSSPGWKPDQR